MYIYIYIYIICIYRYSIHINIYVCLPLSFIAVLLAITGRLNLVNTKVYPDE